MFKFDEIELVHLELTTRCNALCPMCRRTAFGGVAPGLAMRDLSSSEIKAIFAPDFVRQLRQIDLCGVHGDPVAARSFNQALAWFRQVNPGLAIEVYTNGALRPARWWADLARGSPMLKVVFAIDGLGDTHEIYRRGASFDKVAENARAFIDAGGRAQWDFLVFRHNEHQVDEARRRAREWGFTAFVPKFSGRFYRRFYENDPQFADDEKADRFPIHDRHGQIAGTLEPSSNPAYVNPVFAGMAEHFARDGSLLPHWDKTDICCSAIDSHSIFVAADGTVFPCCWTYGASLYRAVYRIDDPLDNQVEDLLGRCGGREAIDGRRIAIRDICKSAFFQEIARSWERKTLASGKLKICARMCGGSLSPYRGQFCDLALVPGRRPRA